MRFALLVFGLAACGRSGTTSIDADGEPIDAEDVDGRPGCEQRWHIDHLQAGGTVTISDGQLVMTQPSMNEGVALAVRLVGPHAGITGDFDASFGVAAFTAGGSGAYLEVRLEDTSAITAEHQTATIGTSPTPGVSVADLPAGSSDLQLTDLTSATLRFQRSGTTVTVTSSTGDATATTTAAVDADPLAVSVWIGSNNGAITTETRVEVDDFTYSGAGAIGDTFDCGSLVE